jgi:hypothetical protein
MIATIELRAKSAGIGIIQVSEMEMLASDRVGTPRTFRPNSHRTRIFVSDENTPSPDQNGDGILSLADAQIIYFSSFHAYDPNRDINRDGKVNWNDVRALLSLIEQRRDHFVVVGRRSMTPRSMIGR